MANLFDAIASAAANIVTQIKDYIETVALVETDPTVHAWAKEPVKPTYNVSEIFGIAPVAVSGEYADLYGAPDLGMEYKTAEYDTGRKWIDGKTIYGLAFEGEFYGQSGTGNIVLHEIVLPRGLRTKFINIRGQMEYSMHSFQLQSVPYGKEGNVSQSDAVFFYSLAKAGSIQLYTSMAGAGVTLRVMLEYIDEDE